MYRGMATTRHRSLVERGGHKTFVKDKGLAHTKKEKRNRKKMSGKPHIHKSKNKSST